MDREIEVVEGGTDLVVVHPDETARLVLTVDLSGYTLQQLAERANAEHHEVVASATTSLLHAMESGAALLAARRRIEPGGWARWVEENLEISQLTASTYVRLATYRTEVLSTGRQLGIHGALAHLRGLPSAIKPSRFAAIPEAILAEARELRASGMSWQMTASMVGAHPHGLRWWLDPEFKERALEQQKALRSRRRAAQRALEREERDRAVRKVGGNAATAYGWIRKTLQVLDQASGEHEDPEAREGLRTAMTYLYRAEDEIVKALKVSRTVNPDVPTGRTRGWKQRQATVRKEAL